METAHVGIFPASSLQHTAATSLAPLLRVVTSPSTMQPLRAAALALACLAAVWAGRLPSAAASDWLVSPPATPVTLSNWTLGMLGGVQLCNGLVCRRFLTSPGWATYDFESLLEGTAWIPAHAQ